MEPLTKGNGCLITRRVEASLSSQMAAPITEIGGTI